MAKNKPKAYDRPMPFPVFVYEKLTLEERQKLRQIIVDPVFTKALRNAHAKKPSTGPSGTGVSGTTEHSMLIANNRLHQLQGWEMFEAALFAQAEEGFARTSTQPKETYSEP
jgi:hypothetical protein